MCSCFFVKHSFITMDLSCGAVLGCKIYQLFLLTAYSLYYCANTSQRLNSICLLLFVPVKRFRGAPYHGNRKNSMSLIFELYWCVFGWTFGFFIGAIPKTFDLFSCRTSKRMSCHQLWCVTWHGFRRISENHVFNHVLSMLFLAKLSSFETKPCGDVFPPQNNHNIINKLKR